MMSREIPKYVQINMTGLDLIERGVALKKGDMYPTNELERVDSVTIEDRLQRRWLLPRTQQQYQAWRNTGSPVIEPLKLTGRAKKRAEAAATENNPPPPPPPELPEVTEEYEPEPEQERGTMENPLRDGFTVDEYYEKHKLPPKSGKKTSRRAQCPHDKGHIWSTALKLWNCCAAQGTWVPEDANPENT